MLFDATFAPLVKGIAAHCPQVRHWVCLSEAAHMPAIEGVANVIAYEDLIAPCNDQFAWPQFDERSAAALCYTSASRATPRRGALVFAPLHRTQRDEHLQRERTGPVHQADHPAGVLMFHINAWCIPYAAPIAGTRLVLPGPRLDGASLVRVDGVGARDRERRRADDLAGHGGARGAARPDSPPCGSHGDRGSAMPQSLIAKFADTYNVEVRHGWGMTETTAVATMGTLEAKTPTGRRPRNMTRSPGRARACSVWRSRWWTKTVPPCRATASRRAN